jgi:hypothetical protein
MTVTVHPKRLLVTAAFLLAFAALLSSATAVTKGVALGVLAVLAYVLVEVLITFNPAV